MHVTIACLVTIDDFCFQAFVLVSMWQMTGWEAMGMKLRRSHTELAVWVRQQYGPFQMGFTSIWMSWTSTSRSTDKYTGPVHKCKISQYQLVSTKKSRQICCLLAVAHMSCSTWYGFLARLVVLILITHVSFSTEYGFLLTALTYGAFPLTPIDYCDVGVW